MIGEELNTEVDAVLSGVDHPGCSMRCGVLLGQDRDPRARNRPPRAIHGSRQV
jgi:hypothetical protein